MFSVLMCLVKVCVLIGEIELMLMKSLFLVKFCVILVLLNSILVMFGVFGIMVMMMFVVCVIVVELVIIVVCECRFFGMECLLLMISVWLFLSRLWVM